jgi:hypothetical protein
MAAGEKVRQGVHAQRWGRSQVYAAQLAVEEARLPGEHVETALA